jgi:SIR2-like protein
VAYIAEGGFRGKFCHRSPEGEMVIISDPSTYELDCDKQTVILKLCGAVDREDPVHDSYVITEDNYIDHLNADFVLQIPIKLREKLRSDRSSFAFLGYRLRGWNLRIIFRRIWGDMGPTSTSWVIRPDPHIDDIQFWNKRNVKTLDASLDEFVEEMNRRLA